MARLSSRVLLRFLSLVAGPTTPVLKTLVWALPISLAATLGISFDFFSSAYLDVSVRQVSLPAPMYSVQDSGGLSHWVAPFGILRVNAFFQLAGAFRRLSRPSSPFDAKASTSSPY